MAVVSTTATPDPNAGRFQELGPPLLERDVLSDKVAAAKREVDVQIEMNAVRSDLTVAALQAEMNVSSKALDRALVTFAEKQDGQMVLLRQIYDAKIEAAIAACEARHQGHMTAHTREHELIQLALNEWMRGMEAAQKESNNFRAIVERERVDYVRRDILDQRVLASERSLDLRLDSVTTATQLYRDDLDSRIALMRDDVEKKLAMMRDDQEKKFAPLLAWQARSGGQLGVWVAVSGVAVTVILAIVIFAANYLTGS